MGQKRTILNFELEGKLDQHIDVEFDGEFDGDGPEAQKPYLLIWTPYGPKNEIF